jgi:hypothetical protein
MVVIYMSRRRDTRSVKASFMPILEIKECALRSPAHLHPRRRSRPSGRFLAFLETGIIHLMRIPAKAERGPAAR